MRKNRRLITSSGYKTTSCDFPKTAGKIRTNRLVEIQELSAIYLLRPQDTQDAILVTLVGHVASTWPANTSFFGFIVRRSERLDGVFESETFTNMFVNVWEFDE
ncbi:hypothetical protein CLF_106909 [Clonorchis sinensis]|uniref:Uncharacterized protein n=1 Tax=Clonorchis sinensis TaxID=79923 RepID=G7YFX2_CLOSI|nr:hypothetical protein CLF_106909 [Clonorchis sinensis]